MTDLTKLVPFRPENVANHKWDEETVRVVLVHPPIVRKLKEHGGVNEDKSRDDGEGSPEIFLGKGTHTKFLEDFRKKRASSLAKIEPGDLIVSQNLKLVAELISNRRLVTNKKAVWSNKHKLPTRQFFRKSLQATRKCRSPLQLARLC
jgi:hypothetical protein